MDFGLEVGAVAVAEQGTAEDTTEKEENPFPQTNHPNPKPEPVELFHAQTATEPSRGHPALAPLDKQYPHAIK